MAADLQAWRRTALRQRIVHYRRAHDAYNVTGRRVVTLADGTVAFSPILPPVGSAVSRRRMRAIVRHMPAITASQRTELPRWRVPHVATIAITDLCQCRCAHCSAASARPGDVMDVDDLRSVIRQAVSLGATSVVLTGGEPLLHPQLEDVVAAVDRRNAVCTLFTNGEWLEPNRVVALKRAGLFGVFVSLDFATAAAHDRNRGRSGLFDRAVAGICACRDAQLPVGISTYVTREKLATGEMDGLMELGRRLEVLEVFIFDVTPAGRLLDQPECVLSEEDLESVRELRRRYEARRDFPRIVNQAMFSTMAYPCVAEGCPAASVQLHVRANGDVTPCDFTPQAFGNIRRRPLGEIWEAMSRHALYRFASPRCRLAEPRFRASLSALSSPS